MKVELLDLKKLVPYARNPRITAHAVDKVAASIKEFGFRQPIVVDSEMVIIAGHTRYQAAQKLGLKKVPVHVAEGLSAEQVKAYRIADNRTGEEAQWDTAKLPEHKDIVIVSLNSELTVKRLFRQNGHIMLVPENPNYDPILIKEGEELKVHGVVTFIIHPAS